MIGFYSGGGKTRKIMGKQRIFRRTGFLEKRTDSEGKKPKYEIQEQIL